jgi:CHRD domain-containing protein
MKKILVLAVLALVFCTPLKAQNNPRAITNFVVFLNGTNEVPPNNSPVAGHGSFTLDGDMLNFSIGGFLGYPFYPTNAGIYGPAPVGKNGRLIFGNLGWGISPPEGLVYGGGFRLTRKQTAQLRAGLWYVNIQSAQFPNGEIRGQVLPNTSELGQGNTEAESSPSGFYGQSLFYHSAGPGSDLQPPAQGTPYRTYISVYNADGTFVKRVVSNPVGQFYSFVKAGNYVLLATPPGQDQPPRNLSQYSPPGSATGLPSAQLVNITVNAKKLTQVDIVYSQVE